jgi:hypothetical protein
MAGSTNFVQINPAASNQQTDSTYDTYALTTGGIPVDSPIPSAWLNKALFQPSTFITALAAVIAAFGPGYTITDTSISALETQLTNFFALLVGIPTCVRTNKTGTYLSGTTYTNNSGKATFQEVTMTATGVNPGADFALTSIIAGVTGPAAWITNEQYGSQSIGFWVPNGATFSATAAQIDGGTAPFSISHWTEVSF